MNEKITDLIYTSRSLCEALRDRHDVLDHDDELKDFVEEVESSLEEVTDLEESEIEK